MPQQSAPSRAFVLAIFVLGAAVRAVDVGRAADGRVRESWRECDYAAVARNFHREGMNILRPRIDWRGDGPGFAEMEFPVLPWMMAVLYRLFGVHEIIGRILSYAFSLAAMLLFWSLARRLLPPLAALAALGLFVLNPLAVRVSNALQPEGLMLALLLLSVLTFWRWLEEGRSRWYWLSAAATAGAILVKAPAAHIGFLLLGLLLWKKGPKALLRPETWIFGFLALVPSVLWYAQAKHLWRTFGNSLGVSNEYHWFGLDLLRSPRLLLGFLGRIVRTETIYVWTPTGALLGIAALWSGRKERVGRVLWIWLSAIGIYYLVAIRTIGDGWAGYYHIVAVPAAALAVGLGAGWLGGLLSAQSRVIRAAVSGALILAFAFQGYIVVRDFRPRGFEGLFSCARVFKPLIPEDALILASGGISRDETGRPVAFNASYMFYWLDRKGWNIPQDGQTSEAVRAFAAKGAAFFVAERATIARAPGFEAALRSSFILRAECSEALLFQLKE